MEKSKSSVGETEGRQHRKGTGVMKKHRVMDWRSVECPVVMSSSFVLFFSLGGGGGVLMKCTL